MPTMFLPKSTPRTIGFIGLGSMGSRMAAQLASSLPRETTLLVLDAAEKTLDTFITEHATGTNNVRHAESASDVAAAAQIVFTALPGPAESRVVYDEMSRAIRAGDPGKIFLECGTVGPACARFCSESITAAGGIYIDSPMSGGIGGAASGTLTFMVGVPDCETPPETVDETTPLLEHVRPFLTMMGSKVYICGGVGTGQTAKLLNNLQEYASLLALSESLLLGTAHGLSPSLLTAIFNDSTGGSWISHNYNPAPGVHPNAPASRGYSLPGFPVNGAIKDLSLAMELARDVGLQPRVGSVTCDANREMASEDRFRRLDYTVIYEWLREKWGL